MIRRFLFTLLIALLVSYEIGFNSLFIVLLFLPLTIRGDDIERMRKTTRQQWFTNTGILLVIVVMGILSTSIFQANDALHAWAQKQPFYMDANAFMASIPYNDASFLWLRELTPQDPLYDVYVIGFIAVYLVYALYAYVTANRETLIRLVFVNWLIHAVLALPFYLFFNVHEVWSTIDYNWGHVPYSVKNCFPSLHTSVAFACLLLALRENKRFAVFWGLYSALIIFTTMYLRIHWVLDVIGGLVLGFILYRVANAVAPAILARLAVRDAVREPGALLPVRSHENEAMQRVNR
ncbi:inositol phosphorylceramide synthase [Aneurinibacillus sp. BA2021]|nr:inositol phosphorylceramide synthase [Aneurinibacillus sp. BA2021]